MNLKIEIMFQGECIESREYKGTSQPLHIPAPNDIIHLWFENKNYSDEYGTIWKVTERIFLIFGADTQFQTVQLYCEPSKLEPKHDV